MLESELARGLHRVAAPEVLWDKIQAFQNRDRKEVLVPTFSREKLTWALLAASLAAALIWGIPAHRSIQSASATQIREWVKTNTGLDVPLVGDPSPLRLASANLSRQGIEIACRIGNHPAKLLISKNKSIPAAKHAALNNNDSTISWGMSNRTYTLACATPADLHIACLLCHSSSERRIAWN
jgi:hypothetical protein